MWQRDERWTALIQRTRPELTVWRETNHGLTALVARPTDEDLNPQSAIDVLQAVLDPNPNHPPEA